MVAGTSRWPRGAPLNPIGTLGRENNDTFIDTNFKWVFSEVKAVKITFRGVIGGENLKILKIFIFWFFDFLDRFYTFTLGLDLFTARGSGHRSRSTHFIFRFKVATILSDFPLPLQRQRFNGSGKSTWDVLNLCFNGDSAATVVLLFCCSVRT